MRACKVERSCRDIALQLTSVTTECSSPQRASQSGLPQQHRPRTGLAQRLETAVTDPLRVARPCPIGTLGLCTTLISAWLRVAEVSSEGQTAKYAWHSASKTRILPMSAMLCLRDLGAASQKFQAYSKQWAELGSGLDGGPAIVPRPCCHAYQNCI